jgi:hypothetical protein
MLNYFFKYLELLDTVFLVLKKKPLRMAFFRSHHRHILILARISTCFSSLGDSFTLLHAAEWKDKYSTFPTTLLST